MHPLLKKQDELFREATELLNKIIVPALKEFGEITIGGSYAYHLLSYPDIDVDIVSDEASDETYEKLCAKLVSLENVSAFKSTNRTDRLITDIRPKGYWLSPKIQYGGNLWSLDIWLQKPAWYTGNTNVYEDALLSLSDEKRITILTLKEELQKNNLYGFGKEFRGFDVYDAVLNSGAHTIEMLRAYKHSLSY